MNICTASDLDILLTVWTIEVHVSTEHTPIALTSDWWIPVVRNEVCTESWTLPLSAVCPMQETRHWLLGKSRWSSSHMYLLGTCSSRGYDWVRSPMDWSPSPRPPPRPPLVETWSSGRSQVPPTHPPHSEGCHQAYRWARYPNEDHHRSGLARSIWWVYWKSSVDLVYLRRVQRANLGRDRKSIPGWCWGLEREHTSPDPREIARDTIAYCECEGLKNS